MEANREQFLWVEKYRPRKIDDCILPDNMKATFKEFVAKGEIPNMLLCGGAGMGKTTVARALCEELGCDYTIINGSLDRNIDTLRNEIMAFATTVSFSGKTKVIILDEADYLNINSTQPALRGFIEEFSQNCRFIFTCNYKNKIIPALHSRTTVIEFKLAKADRPKLAASFFKRVGEILNHENVVLTEPKIIAKVIERHFPDYRRILNELQRYSSSGTIDAGILGQMAEINTKELLDALREKDFRKMRQWVANNSDADASIYRTLYDDLSDHIDSLPQFILLLADYQYKDAFVIDHEINLTACLTEIMSAVKFK